LSSSDPDRLRPDPLELAAGVPFGHDAVAHALPSVGRKEPRYALEQALVSALDRAPCIVAFSGGRDSSALLALAVDVARREHLPAPVPVTLRFRNAPMADESEWQELVIGHLGVEDWVRLEFDDELDYVGPFAQRVLERHGVLWPANAYIHVPILEHSSGGSLVDGVDGDSVFAWGYQAAIDLLFLRSRPTRPALSNLKTLLRPVSARARRLEPAAPFLPWLTAAADDGARARIATDSASEPVSYSRRLGWYLGSRHAQMLLWTTGLLASETDTLVVRPFLDPRFLAAWGRHTGRFGHRGRTAAIDELFGDLLPAAVVAREDKGMYWHYWGQASRSLARAWSGEGVDERYVDRDALVKAWATTEYPTPDHRTALLLQSAWLASR
jgi:asparagine synthase (glutamine-hydrolysing)